jgi:tetratricopeptide (TPR) repeat protein
MKPIRLLASPRLNAWSVPPDQLFVTVGLVDFVDSDPRLKGIADDVLAFVLGHEWTHILQRDYHRSEAAREAIAGLMQDRPIVWELLRAGIGRAVEMNADRHGLLFAYRAGYAPHAAELWCEATIAQAGDWNSSGNHPSLRERQQQMAEFLEGTLQQAYRFFEVGVTTFAAYQQASLEGDRIEAIRHLQPATDAFSAYQRWFPNDSAVLENLSVLYFLRGVSCLDRPPWGKWRLSHDIQTEPELQPPSKFVTVTPEARRWWERAQRQAKLLLRTNPASSTAYQVLGDVALGFGQAQQAMELYQKGLEIRPAARGLLNNLAVLHARHGDLKRAQELWTGVQDLPAAEWNLKQIR